MTHLEPCPHCHRHVKVTEASCPFCTGSLAEAFASWAPRVAPRARLGRAATFAFGAIAAAQGGCGDEAPSRNPAPDAVGVPADASRDAGTSPDADLDGGDVPIYAAAPTPVLPGAPSRG